MNPQKKYKSVIKIYKKNIYIYIYKKLIINL